MNYKKMYHELFNATEKAVNILIEAQQKCEDIYVDEFNCDIKKPIPTIKLEWAFLLCKFYTVPLFSL